MWLFLLLLLASAPLPAQSWSDFVSAASRAALAKNYSEAEKLALQAVHETQNFGESDERYAVTLNVLAGIYVQENKWKDADATYRKTIAVISRAKGPDSVDTANAEFNFAAVLSHQGNYDGAIQNYRHALPFFQRNFGTEDIRTAKLLELLGDCYRNVKNFSMAEDYLRQAALSQEAAGGIESPELGEMMNLLQLTYTSAGKPKEAQGAAALRDAIRTLNPPDDAQAESTKR